ncbi:hypothetical protein LWI28_006674 [Acer negundo]|uniref:Uncharacterized protein n=1 Tax=Acer negundo TaxID=4023 RepID=A0AAD5IUK9_ACENE|nr:hypothetical protein LWI28_006674 [Acer negundo]
MSSLLLPLTVHVKIQKYLIDSSKRDADQVPLFAPGTFKINTGAAIDVISKQMGVGIIIRDHKGHIMAASSQKLPAVFSPQIMEAGSNSHSSGASICERVWSCPVFP